ncbi:MAG: hypothetical protein LDL33_08685 [Desulfomonile sp.]|nr:hypothetical protein [Desulfomonile sp.]
MKTLTTIILVCVTVVPTVLSYAVADTVDDLIRGLKDPSPEVRVKAIKDLCGG